MNIRICYSSAHNRLQDELSRAFSTASSVGISVAFVTKYGFDFLEHSLELHNPDLRFVASVRYPTDLDRMAEFSRLYPGRTWIHLGGLTPEEKKADRYQLHSKILKFEDSQGEVNLYIGSHNLTKMALMGINIEAGAHIQCSNKNKPAIDVTNHIEACINESQIFDPSKLDFYKAVQAALNFSVPNIPRQSLDEFEREQRIVILAEVSDSKILNNRKLQLFFSPSGNRTADAMILTRKIALYLYPKNGLFDRFPPHPPQQPPEIDPIYFDVEITMVNDSADAAVQQRPINSKIIDLKRPVIESTTTIPPERIGEFQVVALLERVGQKKIPVYHVGGHPKVKQNLEYSESVNIFRTYDDAYDLQEYYTRESVRGNELVTKIPLELFEKITLNIPNMDIYRENPFVRLNEIDAERIQDLGRRRSYEQMRKTKKSYWETTYFYYVDYSRELNNIN